MLRGVTRGVETEERVFPPGKGLPSKRREANDEKWHRWPEDREKARRKPAPPPGRKKEATLLDPMRRKKQGAPADDAVCADITADNSCEVFGVCCDGQDNSCSPADCFCDEACLQFGDCCDDYIASCLL